MLKLVVLGKKHWSFNKLALDLGMSSSEVHGAAKRALAAGLAVKEGDAIRPDVRNLGEFLDHGIQYVFVPDRGGLIRGIPTACAAPPLSHTMGVDEFPAVWPDPEGTVRGESFSPLYKSAPVAAKNDPDLYPLLALVDAIRGGRAGECDVAKKELKKRLLAAGRTEDVPLTGDTDSLVIGDRFAVSRAALHELARRYHIRRLALFGSAVRGELKPDSDIDLLVEFEDGEAPSLGGMVNIQEDLSELFGGCKVDVATPSILNNPYRRRAIEKEMEELYAA